jgi:tetratricopeptide (TPR) repeat protein
MTKKKRTEYRRSKNPKKTESVPSSLLTTEGSRQLNIVVSYDSLENPMEASCPKDIQIRLDDLFQQVMKTPESTIEELEKIKREHPNAFRAYNYLAIAYSKLGQNDKATAIACENYKNNPDYLFAKLNYAEICMEKGEFNKVPEIFDHMFDIKLMYPERSIFHITEVVNFIGITGLYFAKTGDHEAAKRAYDILDRLAPDNFFKVTIGLTLANKDLKENFGIGL